jgi:hypothetical protein
LDPVLLYKLSDASGIPQTDDLDEELICFSMKVLNADGEEAS